MASFRFTLVKETTGKAWLAEKSKKGSCLILTASICAIGEVGKAGRRRLAAPQEKEHLLVLVKLQSAKGRPELRSPVSSKLIATSLRWFGCQKSDREGGYRSLRWRRGGFELPFSFWLTVSLSCS
ncbi:hypothetical protein JCGZ_04244 [Jatropha curcas]|uniref:Uncharacterized protein n=1 Tax=Jatropha curcas TaxID=180498 RepID=A0A067L6W5_JATCU|nr:hypothetical protein JCGZ_04244 [Jatropha curcas]